MDYSGESCPNCGGGITGPYCSVCGQRHVNLDRPFREIVAEGLSTFLAFDTRFVRTLGPLVRRPGFLTEEFMAGRRIRYVHPFKLYFAFSLVFFFVFSISDYSVVHTNEPGIVSIITEDSDTAARERPTPGNDLAVRSTATDAEKIGEFFAPLEELAEKDPEAFDRLFVDRLSKSLIVLVPIVALLLQIVFWTPRYVAHLVFSLHLHSFSFFALVVGAAADGLIGLTGTEGSSTGNSIATVVILIYAFIALRRVYDQGRIVTGAKLLVLMIGYALSLVATMIGTLVVTVAGL